MTFHAVCLRSLDKEQNSSLLLPAKMQSTITGQKEE